MKPLARIVLLAAAPLALVVSINMLSSTPAAAPKAQDVFVTNPQVPITGPVDATQSGPWSVTLSGTPTVAVSSLPPVNVASLPATGVNVTNPQDPNFLTPVPLVTRDVNAADKQPLAFGGVADFNNGDYQIVVDMGTVPADRFFVAEFLSVRMALPASERVFLIFFPDVQHHFAPTFAGVANLGGAIGDLDIAVLSQPVRFTYTSNSLVRFNATRLNSLSGSGNVIVGLSGYSVRPCTSPCA